jgi:transposase
MDVHQNSIDIAIAEKGRQGQLRHFGTIESSLAKVVRKLVSNGKRPCFVYEAGPCGYQIYRHLTAKGFDCAVVAPSLVPGQSGNRINNDRRDSLMLARVHRAGELTAVCVPHDDDEALRDLTRAREDAKIDEKKAKHRLLAFLLRSGHRYSGRASWSQAHRRWLADLKMPHRCQQIVLQEYIEALSHCSLRLQRLTDQIRQLVPQWRLFPVVHCAASPSSFLPPPWPRSAISSVFKIPSS